jgi:hypothetical protein
VQVTIHNNLVAIKSVFLFFLGLVPPLRHKYTKPNPKNKSQIANFSVEMADVEMVPIPTTAKIRGILSYSSCMHLLCILS